MYRRVAGGAHTWPGEDPMKKLAIAVCFAAVSLAPALAGAQAAPKTHPHAAKTPHELTPQQQKMKDCNAQAKEKHLKGKEHKSFMSECLKGKPAT
jgi:hypothetical protein